MFVIYDMHDTYMKWPLSYKELIRVIYTSYMIYYMKHILKIYGYIYATYMRHIHAHTRYIYATYMIHIYSIHNSYMIHMLRHIYYIHETYMFHIFSFIFGHICLIYVSYSTSYMSYIWLLWVPYMKVAIFIQVSCMSYMTTYKKLIYLYKCHIRTIIR